MADHPRKALLTLMDRYDIMGRFIPVDGHDVFVVEKGQGAPLVLIHGYASCTFTWRHNLEYLSQFYRVIAFDLPGFGLSSRASYFRFTLAEYVNFVAALFAKLRIDSVSLYGHSFGGTICTEFLRTHQSMVRSLVLEAVPVVGDNFLSEKALRNLLLFYYADKSLVNDDVVQVFQSLNILADKDLPNLLSILATDGDRSDMEALYELPTLILWGEKDRILSVDAARKLRQMFKGAQYHVVPCCGHAPHEENPVLTHSIIKRFMRAAH